MTPDEFREARRTLGERWGLGQQLSTAQMARFLRLRTGHRAGEQVIDMGNGRQNITGPISRAIEFALDGAYPRDMDLILNGPDADTRPDR